MRVALYILAAAALGAAGWFWIWKPASQTAVANMPAITDSPTAHSLDIPASAPATRSSTTTSGTAANYPDYRKQVHESTDLLPFMQMLLERANEGEPAAKYWLWAAMPICRQEYEFVFTSNDGEYRELTLDGALQQHASAPKFDGDEIRRLYDKCKRLREAGFEQFSDLDKWLEQSSDDGYPLGQVVWASMIVEDVRPFSSYSNSQVLEDSLEEARELAIKGLKSGDPETLRQAGRIAFQMHADDDDVDAAGRAARAWIMAACLRGAGCGPQAEWVKYLCRSDVACQPFETAVDIMRRQTGAEFDELERRALEISALIDDGKWDEIDFK